MDYVDVIERGEPPANPTKIVQASMLSEGKPRPAVPVSSAPTAISADRLSQSKSN